MLVDRTLKFKSIRKLPTRSFQPELLLLKIRELVSFTRKQLYNLKLLQERQCLPSFSRRKEKKEEINKLKNEIRLLIARLDIHLKEISNLDYDQNLKKRIKDYFAVIIHQILLEYREIQQKYLKRIKDLQIFDDLEDTRPFQSFDQQNIFSQKKQDDILNVRNSLYFITSMLLEMKTIIASHTEMIDKIDLLMDETNFNIDKANREIEKIPKQFGGMKDKIIIFLVFLMVLMFSILVFKSYRKRKMEL